MFEAIPEILTLKQGQEVLHIGRTTILNMIKQKELKAFKVREDGESVRKTWKCICHR